MKKGYFYRYPFFIIFILFIFFKNNFSEKLCIIIVIFFNKNYSLKEYIKRIMIAEFMAFYTRKNILNFLKNHLTRSRVYSILLSLLCGVGELCPFE